MDKKKIYIGLAMIAAVAIIGGIYWLYGRTGTLPNGSTNVAGGSAGNGSINQPEPKPKVKVKIFLVKLEDNGKNGKKIGCNDSVVAVEREVEPTKALLPLALEELFAIKEQFIDDQGIYNSLWQSNLSVSNIETKNGKALVNLTGQIKLGGVCDDPRAQAQIEQTILQFPEFKGAEVRINNVLIEKLLSGKGL